jgi:hypothetical protein
LKKEQEKPKVPSGVHPKVNVGELLDKFHAANKKGFTPGAKAAVGLQGGLRSYITEAKKKYPKWAARVDDRLLSFVDDYVESYTQAIKHAKAYPASYKKANVTLMQAGAEHAQWVKGGKNGKFKPSNEKALNAAMMEFVGHLSVAPSVSDKVPMKLFTDFQQAVAHGTDTDWGAPMDVALKLMPKLPPSL